jgi:hypothetical protein
VAITYGRGATNAQAAPASPITDTVVGNAGETGLTGLSSGAAASANLVTASSVTGGGTWNRATGSPENSAAGFAGIDVLMTAVNAVLATASVAKAWAAGSPASVCSATAFYTGVAALGAVWVATGNTTTPTIAVNTQDNDNVVVAFITCDNGAAFPVDATKGTDRVQNFATSGIDNAILIKDNTRATPGALTIATGAYGFNVNWSIIAVELRSVGAAAAVTKALCRESFGFILGEDRKLLLTS